MLALVLALVFGLSTFHGHADASLGHDVTLTVGIAADGVAPEKAPDQDDRHDPSSCPVCALHMHILLPTPIDFAIELVGITQRYAVIRETAGLRRPSELHRPPIDAAT